MGVRFPFRVPTGYCVFVMIENNRPPSTHTWFDVFELRETEKGILFDVEGREILIPKKHMGARKKEAGKIIKLELSKKFARSKDLIT